MLSLDIQVEIIKRLPAESLIRFRPVCKAWKSLIDSSHFIAGYNDRDRHDLPQHLVVNYTVEFGEEREEKYVSFVDDDTFPQQKVVLTAPPPFFQETIIIGSTHGLLCLVGYLGETNDSSRTHIAVLWNPAIRKSIAVVVPDVVHRSFSSVIGFGVCPDTKDPKLVKVKYIEDRRKVESISSIPYQVMVFSLSSGEWTTSSCTNLPRKSIRFTFFQTVIGRFIYWLAHDENYVDGGFCKLIMSFDMSTEEFTEVDLPDSLAKNMREALISVSRLRESLAVVEYTNVVRRVCNVWIMDHGDSKAFTKLYTINLPNASVLKTIGFRKSGEPIVEMRNDNQDFGTPCPLVVYDPHSEHIKDLGICGYLFPIFATSYTESLLLLNYDDGHIVKCGAVKG